MNDERPKPKLEDSLIRLRQMEEFQVVCATLRTMREDAIRDFATMPDSGAVMALSGTVAALHDTLEMFEGPPTVPVERD